MELFAALKSVTALFFPDGCVVCGKATDDAAMCAGCREKIGYIREPICPRCGRPFASGKGVSHICLDCVNGENKFIMSRAVFEYNEAIAKLIQRFKFGDRVSLVSFFADELEKLYGIQYRGAGVDALVPVPLSRQRLRRRSYNQSLLLANALAERLSLPVYPHVLEKVIETPPQSKLSAEMRRENVKHAYNVSDGKPLKGKKVLLIDDVVTTGSTINACTRAFRRAGIKQVYVMAVAMRV